MYILSDYEPKRVFYYFEEISKIPHGSYHEKQISDYLVSFAKSHQLSYIQDDLNNVIIFVDASEGYKNEEPIILQGHMDMVCEKSAQAEIDLLKEGLELETDGTYVFAKNTTLGGDDGIAVAYMLAIAEDKTILHPPLELVITVCEEVGMEGATGIDLSMLKGRRMLNLDSEEEGVFLSSCAGGLSLHGMVPVNYHLSEEMDFYELSITGLIGGHSGCEIHKERGNANLLLGRVLYTLHQNFDLCLCELEGGKKDNVIPFQATAKIGILKMDAEKVAAFVRIINDELKREYVVTDPDVLIMLEKREQKKCNMILDDKSLQTVLTLLMVLPNGVQGMSMSVENLVETSLNLGVIRLSKDGFFMQHSIRSNVKTKKEYIASKVEALIVGFGGSVKRTGDYPAWEYKKDSVVRERVIEIYQKMYGKVPIVEGIHAGLECGILASKIEQLDCVALGPDIFDIHTVNERLDIASTQRVYEFLIQYLKIKDGEKI